MINSGPSKDVMGLSTSRNASGDGRSFVHNGLRGNYHADVILFPNRFHVVFVANSPTDADLSVSTELFRAYRNARQ